MIGQGEKYFLTYKLVGESIIEDVSEQSYQREILRKESSGLKEAQVPKWELEMSLECSRNNNIATLKKKNTTLLKHSKKVKNPMNLKRLAGSISYRKLGRDSLNVTCVLLYFIVREYIPTQRLRRQIYQSLWQLNTASRIGCIWQISLHQWDYKLLHQLVVSNNFLKKIDVSCLLRLLIFQFHFLFCPGM